MTAVADGDTDDALFLFVLSPAGQPLNVQQPVLRGTGVGTWHHLSDVRESSLSENRTEPPAPPAQ